MLEGTEAKDIVGGFNGIFDFWSSKGLHSYYGLIFRIIDENFQLHEKVVGVEYIPKSHDSELVLKLWAEMTRDFRSPSADISITVDGGSEIRKAAKKKDETGKPVMVESSDVNVCFLHMYHCVFNSVFKSHNCKGIFSAVDMMLSAFAKSRKRRQMLGDMLEKQGKKNLQLIFFVPNRWNGRADTLFRLFVQVFIFYNFKHIYIT